MTNRIDRTFQTSKGEGKKTLIAFITGGDPDIETTEKLILAMAEVGVDIVEIGIPFSDPVAEGEVIQRASKRALENGCTVDKLFDMVKRLRLKTEMPLLFMTYANPIYAYGKGRFMKTCQEVGIDGVIVPDVPFEEKEEFSHECKAYNVRQISLVAPTSKERVALIAKEAEGFLYCVSSLGVTGMRKELNTQVAEWIQQVRKVSDIPCAIGFGISTPEQAGAMASISDGVIIGSGIVKIVGQYGRESILPVQEFLCGVREKV